MDKDFSTICPQNEDFVRVFLDEAGLDEKEALLKHAISCQECGLKFDVLRQLRRKLKSRMGTFQNVKSLSDAAELLAKATGAQLEKGKKEKKKSLFSLYFRRAPAKFVLVTFLFFIITVTGVFLTLRSPKTGLFRGEAGQQLTLIEPLGKINQPPRYFKWTKVKNAEHLFRLIDDSLNTLAKAKIRNENTYALPPSIKDQLKKNKTYIWSVEALDDNGRILDVKSGHFSIK